jgi:arylsulfatase A-like enzyme
MMKSFLIFAICFAAVAGPMAAGAAEKPNVLFIAIDDMNHWVGHLGRHGQAKTPHIDRLAQQGVAFAQAYCTAPACKPSRASLMSGLRPSTTGCYMNDQDWRSGIGDDKLLNTQFAAAGYRVYGAGKIYHNTEPAGTWHEYFVGHEKARRHPEAKDDGVGGIRFYPLENSDEDMVDYAVVDFGLKKLQEKSDKPFFLAIGLKKPHMPFSVPKKWFDQFPLDTIELPPHRDDDLDDVPPAGVKMARPQGDHAKIVKSGRWKEAVQAYLATMAFADAQVGRLLDGLEASPHRDNTIVVLWSDHGWSLGEKSHWRKFALWEEPTRSVCVWRAPGVTQAGGVCRRPIDFTAIYPTLCELTALAPPEHLEGRSIVSLLKDPQAAWDQPALITYGRKNHAVRTEGWRYIRYDNGDEELYDVAADPLEYVNLAKDGKYAAQIAELAKWLPATDAPRLPKLAAERRKGKKAQRSP